MFVLFAVCMILTICPSRGSDNNNGKLKLSTEEKNMIDNIHWLGHDSFRIDGDKTIYIDPWKLTGGVKADIILITHEHYDHCSPTDIAALQTESTEIICTKECLEKLSGSLHSAVPGSKYKFDNVEIEAVPAYNTNKKFHPQGSKHVGYIIKMNGVRIYHAGDTDFIPEMSKIKCDIALLPVSGTYVMTAKEAVQAAEVIKPRVAIPMHWGDIIGGREDAEYFSKNVTCECIIKEKE